MRNEKTHAVDTHTIEDTTKFIPVTSYNLSIKPKKKKRKNLWHLKIGCRAKLLIFLVLVMYESIHFFKMFPFPELNLTILIFNFKTNICTYSQKTHYVMYNRSLSLLTKTLQTSIFYYNYISFCI